VTRQRVRCRYPSCCFEAKATGLCDKHNLREWREPFTKGRPEGFGDSQYVGNGTIICFICGRPTKDAPHKVGWPCPLMA